MHELERTGRHSSLALKETILEHVENSPQSGFSTAELARRLGIDDIEEIKTAVRELHAAGDPC